MIILKSSGEKKTKLAIPMKLAGLVDSGVDAKLVIQDGLVRVNGEIDRTLFDNT